MKLLIIDDEKLTREGLIQNIDWDGLGINEVLQSDDGVNALVLVKEHHPDIILSDIRMPRLNGIQLVNKVYELLPDTSIIFMSGYSDKEYLKAAIKLKAISYVEKPIDHDELKEAVQEAIDQVHMIKHHKLSTDYHLKEQNSQLALLLTQNDKTMNHKIHSLIESLHLSISDNTYITTCIVDLQTAPSKLGSSKITDFLSKWKDILYKKDLNILSALKNDKYLIAHIYKNEKVSAQSIYNACAELQVILTDICRFFIAIGITVKGPFEVNRSYQSAAILLQSAFFSDYNTILSLTDAKADTTLWRDQIPTFVKALTEKNFEQAKYIVNSLYHNLKNCQTMLPNQVKDIYYKYFIQLGNCLVKNQLSSSGDQLEANNNWDSVAGCHTLKELHSLLLKKLESIFETLESGATDHPIVYQIKDFICKNYSIETLSVKDIGEHVYLSTSYVCTLFKAETGQTLNQYLTEYRIDMAKQLLDDSHYKITDISSRVGYHDGNYFSKTFKKYVGLTPSEYREKMLK